MYFTYVLRSLKDRKLYIGYSRNIEKRLKDHNEGKVTSTKHRRPLELLFYEAFMNEADALRRETYFKTTKGKVSLQVIAKESLRNEQILYPEISA